jgi:hypothetical protein
MNMRRRIGESILWLTVLAMGVITGAGLFQRMSLIPAWTRDLPGSVVVYFKGTMAAQDFSRFWATVVPVSALLVIGTLIFNLADRPRRRWIAIGAGLFSAVFAATLLYFVPKGVVPLMVRAGAGMSGEEITRVMRQWVFWDGFRMAAMVGCFFAFVKAVTLRVALVNEEKEEKSPTSQS